MTQVGENIPLADKAKAEQIVKDADQMLLIGTSLATYSAYRLLKQAHDAGKATAMLNVGTSRGDDLSKYPYASAIVCGVGLTRSIPQYRKICDSRLVRQTF